MYSCILLMLFATTIILTAMAGKATFEPAARVRGAATSYSMLRVFCAVAAGALAAITAISNSGADSSGRPGAAGEQQQEAHVKPIVEEADVSEEESEVGEQEPEQGPGQGAAIRTHEEIE